jgi:hypothetical protein
VKTTFTKFEESLKRDGETTSSDAGMQIDASERQWPKADSKPIQTRSEKTTNGIAAKIVNFAASLEYHIRKVQAQMETEFGNCFKC